MARHSILKKYDDLKKAVKNNLYSDEVTKILGMIFLECLSNLSNLKREPLISKVEGKTYFAFDNGKKISRAINKDLFKADYSGWENLSNAIENKDLGDISITRGQVFLFA